MADIVVESSGGTVTIVDTTEVVEIITGQQGPVGPQGPAGPTGAGTWGTISGTLSNQTDLQSALDGKSASGHSHTKADVGLGNVDNTSDSSKPVSNATQSAINAKQDTLVSGTNIKTVNGNSLLGSGDLVISGGGGGRTWNLVETRVLNAPSGSIDFTGLSTGNYAVEITGKTQAATNSPVAQIQVSSNNGSSFPASICKSLTYSYTGSGTGVANSASECRLVQIWSSFSASGITMYRVSAKFTIDARSLSGHTDWCVYVDETVADANKTGTGFGSFAAFRDGINAIRFFCSALDTGATFKLWKEA